MKAFEIKDFDNRGVDFKDAPFDVDDKTRRVKVALNKVGVKDHDKDIIDDKAYDVTIKQRGPKGKGLIWHLTDHYPSLKYAVGRFKEMFMENSYLVGVTDIPATTWGNDVLEFYKSGHINQHSIGFTVAKKEVFNDDDPTKRYTLIKEVILYEGSAVLWGANEYTPTLEVGKSLTLQEMETEFEKTLKDFKQLHKMFKSGHFTDDTYELIEIKQAQLAEKLQHLFKVTNQPAQKAVDPEMKDVFTQFINTLKTADHGRERLKEAVG